ncbi:phosphoribosylglycinamide formyltransferase [Marinivivus vitaminiproducens]|uniref:phosphoribosylglycinamide formyltransferase n=1 Tax=Marinivivus vitaminiproducens TaxID=3035935 RepID=UPI0027A46366|nr:phosphoribosylglycinamide formyltransferase [Geminicoccaceae bacterium SCSIO 64248]
MGRRRTAVLISGRGSNLQALLDATRAPDHPAEIVRVISNRAGAFGLERAAQAGVATSVVAHRDYPDRPSFERALQERLLADGVELVCLAGFMRVLTPYFVDAWRDRLINIHPSLLPAFPGLDTHARALAAGVRFTGCTVHFVRTEVDLGPIIVQAAVPVLEGDDPERLAARVLEAEHRCYPIGLRLVAGGQARIEGERVVIAGGAHPPGITIHPDL